MTGFWRSPTGEESEKLQGLVAEIYDNFVSVRSQGSFYGGGSSPRAGHRRNFHRPAAARNWGSWTNWGDFDHALTLTAKLGGVRPRPVWVRPKRAFSQRLLGQLGSNDSGLSSLTAGPQRLLSGGIYYLEPSHLLS